MVSTWCPKCGYRVINKPGGVFCSRCDYQVIYKILPKNNRGEK